MKPSGRSYAEATVEQDPEKLLELTRTINELLLAGNAAWHMSPTSFPRVTIRVNPDARCSGGSLWPVGCWIARLQGDFHTFRRGF
jgi:hypothetical protein